MDWHLALLLLHGLPQTQEGGISSPSCPSGWVSAQTEGCFNFLGKETGLNWMEAMLACEEVGGFLAEPKTEEQMEFLRGIAELEAELYGVQNWWIGLSDSGHEGRWVWAHSTEEVGKTFWSENSPANSSVNTKDCVYAALLPSAQLMWIDITCLVQQTDEGSIAPLCQRETDQETETTTEIWPTAPTTTSTAPTETPTTTTLTTTTSPGCGHPGYCHDNWEGKYEDPENCRGWWVCLAGGPDEHHLCPLGAPLYDPITNSCKGTSQVICGHRPICDDCDQNCYDQPKGGCLVHDCADNGDFCEETCSPYFCRCDEDGSHLRACHPGQVWSCSDNKCQDMCEAGCC